MEEHRKIGRAYYRLAEEAAPAKPIQSWISGGSVSINQSPGVPAGKTLCIVRSENPGREVESEFVLALRTQGDIEAAHLAYSIGGVDLVAIIMTPEDYRAYGEAALGKTRIALSAHNKACFGKVGVVSDEK